MHSVGGRRGMEDVIVAEDFTFAAASAMADDVTGLWVSHVRRGGRAYVF
jgi:hypothetical protein